MIGNGEPLPSDAGQITAGKNAGPVVDRVWGRPPRGGGVPVPTRTVPTSSGYPRPTRPGVGELPGVTPDAGPYYYVKAAAIAAAAVAAVTAGAIYLQRRKTTAPARLRGARTQITDKTTLDKRLKAFRRSFDQLEAMRVGDVDEAFLKLRKRLDAISSASSGFFPEANDMTDQALKDLLAAREEAKVHAREALDEERRKAIEEEREARRRARPWEYR